MRNTALGISFVTLLSLANSAVAQDASTPPAEPKALDEVIAYGQQSWGHHDGMTAFFSGDYETAEIEFEREFLSLKRSESAKENAIEDASNSILRSEFTAESTPTGGTVISTPGGSVSVGDSGGSSPTNIGGSTNFRNKRSTGGGLLTDGKVTYEDFAFSKYMSGLSELQLGKFDEAKVSFIRSLKFNRNNFDARMRLGLLYVKESDFERAADQLEHLDKLRKKCNKKSCEGMAEIREATLTLSNAITTSVAAQ